jgi:8-oxo-dGTP pyrophosphatase MutT (NUDIX family)
LEQWQFLRDGRFAVTLDQRLQQALAAGMARDVQLIPHDSNVGLSGGPRVAAAVLIAVTDQAEPTVILTQRPQSMRKHPGQVAFPGGRVDETDADVIAAALREAEEEVSLPPSLVRIIGTTDVYRTITDYEITPVIAVTPPGLVLVPNDEEVAAIFEVPLAYLLDPANHAVKQTIYAGLDREYFEIHWQDRRTWGATAAMIVNLSRRLAWQA